jgi:hypothetical protein
LYSSSSLLFFVVFVEKNRMSHRLSSSCTLSHSLWSCQSVI